MTGREQLKQAIAALEAQRNVLGEAIVEAALGPMRKELAELEQAEGRTAAGFGDERKQVTVVFADISGFTSQAEKVDHETVRELVNACFDRLLPIIEKYEGTVEKFIGDEIMAIFGAPVVHENDPERALRAALGIKEELGVFKVEYKLNIGLRIGISTGLVVAGGIGSEGRQQYGVTGEAVNLAKRLQEQAPVDGVLISHATYRHVRGVFNVLPHEPILVKGKDEPVQTYIVEEAKPRAFHMSTQGVEGIETRMVGREAEYLTLQNVFRDVMEDCETRVVTVVGEAGVGKSRLLYEFEKWIELLEEEVWYFKGWATEGLQSSSYGVMRSMFALRFEILESDNGAAVRNKIRSGLAPALSPDRADLVGRLIGFDLQASQTLQNALESELFREQALAGIVDYFKSVVQEPTVILLEDMHWADDSSLDLVDHLTSALPDAHLLVICLARPALFERRPNWGEGQDTHTCLELKALSRRQSRALVAEILQKAEQIPDRLCDLVVEGAEGNPFYVEELIKMLIDDGVIQGGEERWHIELERLKEARVPTTLAGVIQARLDSLPAEERSILQRASVVGRLFWNTAVAELSAAETEALEKNELDPLLEAVRRRELVYRREHSTFTNTEEYIFKHALLRDVTYETVLLKLRRVYHRRVAGWLEAVAGERLGEYLVLIAGHYELAGDLSKAAAYLLRAGDRARLDYAHQEAIESYQRALAFLKELGGHAQAARTQMKLGLVYHTAFDYQRARQAFEEGFALWRRAKETQADTSLSPAPHAFRMARANPLTLDPTMADDSFSSGIINQLFSGLVEGRLAMETMPDIALSWEISEGGRKYVFHLRDDVRWSDGVPLTAADFEVAWKRTLDPSKGSPHASMLYDIKGARAFHQGENRDPGRVGVRAVDAHTLVVELEEPTGYFLSLLAHYAAFPVPRHILEAYGEAWTEKDKLVTNGAFQLESWEKDKTMSLLHTPGYHGRFSGNLQRVDVYFDVKWSGQLEMYEAEELDFLSFGGTMVERDHARRRHAGEYVSAPMLGATYVGFDVSRPPFDDLRVRQAFAMATDKHKLADEILRGYEFPAVGGFVPPGVPGHSTNFGQLYNPEQAQETLAEAGYPGGQGFPRVEAWTWQGIKNRAEYLRAQWMDILGVSISWEVMDFPRFIQRVDREPANMIQTVWMPDYPDPDSVLRASPIRRRAHWQNETFEKLVEEARRALDQSERLQLYAQADRMMVEDEVVLIPLTYMWSHILIKPWVRRFPASAINEWLWKDFVIEPHGDNTADNYVGGKDD
jgi:ABC-type oligopeptide transport system substrate-binding subunit/class 3 adenylate cyclase